MVKREVHRAVDARITSLGRQIKDKTAQLNQEIVNVDLKAKLSDVLVSLKSVGISVDIKESFSDKYLKELMFEQRFGRNNILNVMKV